MEADLIPEILPVDSRLSLTGEVAPFRLALSKISRIVPSKEVVPGTSQAHIKAVAPESGSEGYARVTATDGSTSISTLWAEGLTILRSGQALIPAAKLIDVLNLCPTSSFTLVILGNEAVLRSGNAQWRIQLLPGNSLPPLAATEDSPKQLVERVPFLISMKAAYLAASHTPARVSLMQIQVKDGWATGIDGSRVHRSRFPDHHGEFTLPEGVVIELIRLLRDSEEKYIEIASGEGYTSFHCGVDYLIAPQMLVDFPDIEPMLVRASMGLRAKLTLNVAELREVLKRVRVNADPEFAAVFVNIDPKSADGLAVSLTCRDRQRNASYERIQIVSWEGPDAPLELCINHRLVSDLLSCYPFSTISFHLGEDTSTTKSGLYVEVDGSFIALIQQMRSDYFN